MTDMLRNKNGRIGISIALTGLAALAGLCFILYVWSNMPESGIENPEIATPILLAGGAIVIVLLLVTLMKKR